MHLILEPMLWPLTRWARRSQRQACRNAMVATTALGAGRRERDEAQEYCAAVIAHRRPGSETASALAR